MEVINLNFIPSGANPVAHASQFDEGRTTRFNLFDGSAVYTLDGTEIITVSVRKPDGHIVTESVTNTSSNYVEVVTTEQMTACAGDNLAQIKVEKGGDTIGFLNYILSVQKDPEDGGDPSASFIHDLETQVADMVATEVANQYDSANVIFDNDPTTGHGVGYAVTSEGVKNAIDAVGNPAASAVSYDNTGSGMTATNVQDAIDELDTNVGDLSTLTTSVTSSLVGAVNEVNKKESETLTYSSGGNTASFKFSRFGNMVCVGGSGGAMPMPTSWTNLTGTLSAKFRPTTALSLALITGDNHLIFLEINTNGTVRVYSNYSGNLYPSGTGIYVTT